MNVFGNQRCDRRDSEESDIEGKLLGYALHTGARVIAWGDWIVIITVLSF